MAAQPYTLDLRAHLQRLARRGEIYHLPRLQPGLTFQPHRPMVVQVKWSIDHNAATMQITVYRGVFHLTDKTTFPFRYTVSVQAWDNATLYRLRAIERALRRKMKPVREKLIPAMPVDPADPLGRLKFAYGTDRINEVRAVLGEAATPEQIEQECRRRFQ